MEISPFPLLSSDDLSQLFPTTPYPDLQPCSPPLLSPSLKRRKEFHHNHNNHNDDPNSGALKTILASLLSLEDEETTTHHSTWPQSSQQQQQQRQPIMDISTNHPPEAPAIAASVTSTDPTKQQRNKRPRDAGEPSAPSTHQRRLWVKDRSKDWWEKCSHPDFPEDEFKKSFRMSKSTFNMICEELEPVITKKDTMLRAAIPVPQRVAVCIWRLATGEPLRLVSKRFGLGISTCHKLVLEVCTAIKTTLMARFIQWPDDARLGVVKDEYEVLSGIPNVGGSIYTTHIPIIAPKVNVGAYFNKLHTERNQKTSYSITVQGVVDSSGLFTDVCIGWPGSMADDKVLEQSALYQRGSRGLLSNVWMVANKSYPLMDWLLVPYAHKNLTWTQHAFNEKVGEIQKVAKQAFHKMKLRWGCLQKRTEVKLQELPAVLGACCVLHNICEMRKEPLDFQFDTSFQLSDVEFLPETPVRSPSAVQARDHIAHNLLHHRLPGTSFL